MEKEQALKIVIQNIKQDQQFAKAAFLTVLKLLPAIPKVPGFEVFMELAQKSVICGVDIALFRKGKVFLTQRESGDPYFQGWHFFGTHREPRATLLSNCQKSAEKEISVVITSAKIIGWNDRPDNPRFHDIGMLVECEFEGEPKNGRWFSEMPKNLIPIHRPFWPMVQKRLKK